MLRFRVFFVPFSPGTYSSKTIVDWGDIKKTKCWITSCGEAIMTHRDEVWEELWGAEKERKKRNKNLTLSRRHVIKLLQYVLQAFYQSFLN